MSSIEDRMFHVIIRFKSSRVMMTDDSCYRQDRHFFGTGDADSPLSILVREIVCRNKKEGSPG